MTLFLIPEMNEKYIIYALESENLQKQDKIILYHASPSSKEYTLSNVSELANVLKKNVSISNDLVQYLSAKGVQSVKQSNFNQGKLERMNEVIIGHIFDFTDEDEEIKIIIPPLYQGDPRIFIALTLVSTFFQTRLKFIYLYDDSLK